MSDKISSNRNALYTPFFEKEGSLSHDAVMREDVRALYEKINKDVRQHLAAVCKIKSNPGSYIDLLALLDEKLHRIHAIAEMTSLADESLVDAQRLNRC